MRGLGLALITLAVTCGAIPVIGQTFPTKPVRIVTAEPGGGVDFATRVLAQGLAASWGQAVIVDNRGVIAAQIVAKAPSDGYTLLLYGSTMWLLPFMRERVPYDPIKDFAPITLAQSSPNILVVHPSLATNSVKDLIALARAKPGELNYATSGTGSANHLAAELFNAMASVNIAQIRYKGAGQALTDVLGGQVQLMFAPPTSAAPHLKSGRLRGLAVTSAQPSLLLPGLPALADSGVPGYEAVSIYGAFAPASTPAALVASLNREMVRVLRSAEVREKFLSAGSEPVGTSPQQFADKLAAEMAKWGKVIKQAGIRSE